MPFLALPFLALPFLAAVTLFLPAGFGRLQAFGKATDVTGQITRLLGKHLLPRRQPFLAIAAKLGGPLEPALLGDQLRHPRDKLPHFFFRAGEALLGIAGLEQRQKLFHAIDGIRLTAARLQELVLLQQRHDRVESITHLRLASLGKHAPQERRPPRVAAGQKISQPEERPLEISKLLEQLLLTHRQRWWLVGCGSGTPNDRRHQPRHDARGPHHPSE